MCFPNLPPKLVPAACWLLESITNSSPSLVPIVSQLSAPGICFSAQGHGNTNRQEINVGHSWTRLGFMLPLQRSSLFQVMTGVLHLVRIISHGTWSLDPTDRRIGEEAIDVLQRLGGNSVAWKLHLAGKVLRIITCILHIHLYTLYTLYTHNIHIVYTLYTHNIHIVYT